jgi:hypothetical protein
VPAQQLEYRGMHVEVVVAVYVRWTDTRLFQPVELRFDLTVELAQKTGPTVFHPGHCWVVFKMATEIRETRDFGARQNGPSITEGHMKPDGEAPSLPGYLHGLIEGGPSRHEARHSEYSPVMRLGNGEVHRRGTAEIICNDDRVFFSLARHYDWTTSFRLAMNEKNSAPSLTRRTNRCLS